MQTALKSIRALISKLIDILAWNLKDKIILLRNKYLIYVRVFSDLVFPNFALKIIMNKYFDKLFIINAE